MESWTLPVQHGAPDFDLTGTYQLTCGTAVVARTSGSVQIGVEPPRAVVLHNAPPESVPVLRGLDGSRTVAAVLGAHRADPLVWAGVLSTLRDRGVLVATKDWSFSGPAADPMLQPERDALIHVHDPATARRLLLARAESLVVVRGSGRAASAIAALLASSGVGHVHQQPDRPLRAADLPGGPPPPDTVVARAGRRLVPDRGDNWVLAERLRAVAASVRTHPPATHHHPDLLVLAGDAPPDPGEAAWLVSAHQPHLLVRTGRGSAVVGPLVLPGRSTCVRCVLHHRMTVDPDWALVETGAATPVVPPAILVSAVAATAATEALALLDGDRLPGTVDGTVEWWSGELTPRRRSWRLHPDCSCHGRPRDDRPRP